MRKKQEIAYTFPDGRVQILDEENGQVSYRDPPLEDITAYVKDRLLWGIQLLPPEKCTTMQSYINTQILYRMLHYIPKDCEINELLLKKIALSFRKGLETDHNILVDLYNHADTSEIVMHDGFYGIIKTMVFGSQSDKDAELVKQIKDCNLKDIWLLLELGARCDQQSLGLDQDDMQQFADVLNRSYDITERAKQVIAAALDIKILSVQELLEQDEIERYGNF